MGELLAACKFPSTPSALLGAGLGEAMALAREANVYTFPTLSAGLDGKAPWVQIKEDREAAAATAYVTQSVRVVDNLKIMFAPFLPHTAQKHA